MKVGRGFMRGFAGGEGRRRHRRGESVGYCGIGISGTNILFVDCVVVAENVKNDGVNVLRAPETGERQVVVKCGEKLLLT